MIHPAPARDIIRINPERRPDLYSDRERRAAAVMLRGLAARDSHYPHHAARAARAAALAAELESRQAEWEHTPTRADYAGAALYLRDRATRAPDYATRAALLTAAIGATNRAQAPA